MNELRDLAYRQRDVVRRVQLYALGVDEATLRAQLDAHRWTAIGGEVVVLHNGPLTRRQQLWAAVLTVAPCAALAGRTAAAEHGLNGWPAETIEVVAERNAGISGGVRRIPGATVYVHLSRRFSAADVHPVRLPPQTGAERSVIDAAAWTSRPRSACGLLAAAVQQGVVTAGSLRDELDRAGKVRHRSLLERALQDIEGGAQALSEVDLVAVCRRHGLPKPVRQVVRRDANGRRRYLDAQFQGPDGRTVAVEVDGAFHLTLERYWDDMSRDNELTIDGDRLLRFPTIALHLDEERVADQIARGLGLVGVRRRYSNA